MNSTDGPDEEMTVLNLTDNVFDFESMEGLPGKEVRVTSIMVPAIQY